MCRAYLCYCGRIYVAFHWIIGSLNYCFLLDPTLLSVKYYIQGMVVRTQNQCGPNEYSFDGMVTFIHVELFLRFGILTGDDLNQTMLSSSITTVLFLVYFIPCRFIGFQFTLSCKLGCRVLEHILHSLIKFTATCI